QVAGSGGLVFASLRLVNGSTGAAGGTTIYDNVVYGANDRGVWLFDGANFLYVSLTLEGAWAAVDVSDEGLLHQQGAFLYRSSQYWLSVRERGSRANSTVFVLHTGAAQAWTRVTLPDHVVLGRNPGPDDRPVAGIGTGHGQILSPDQEQGVAGLLRMRRAEGRRVVNGE